MPKPDFQEFNTVPEFHQSGIAYVIPAQTREAGYYDERTNRNIGWITREEQLLINKAVVSIAGTGGMGGLASQIMVRLGVGELRIADPESFDVSNINRQLAAGINTIGRSKALETGRILRNITDDYRLVIYPQGIEEGMIDSFVRDADIIIDEIEFWNIGSCILMHQAARSLGVPIFNCLTVGFATYLHYFAPDSTPIEELLGIDLEEALELERKVLNRTISSDDRTRLMNSALKCFIPDLPNYFSGSEAKVRQDFILHRLEKEGTASIIATNPSVAAGIVANYVLFNLLEKSGVERSIQSIPTAPNYLVIDTAHLTSKIIRRDKVI
jgi:molybdopterin/thiamine biosynthesis adenylyltransferase